jgi:hypothetical protein
VASSAHGSSFFSFGAAAFSSTVCLAVFYPPTGLDAVWRRPAGITLRPIHPARRSPYDAGAGGAASILAYGGCKFATTVETRRISISLSSLVGENEKRRMKSDGGGSLKSKVQGPKSKVGSRKSKVGSPKVPSSKFPELQVRSSKLPAGQRCLRRHRSLILSELQLTATDNWPRTTDH